MPESVLNILQGEVLQHTGSQDIGIALTQRVDHIRQNKPQ
jgi:hypothetical protein